jgi:glycosyltransferase involved in cell wall biosynthesis
MRVLFVTTSFPGHPQDPAGHFVQTEAHAWAQRGAHVTVVLPTTADATRDAPPGSPGLRLLRVPAGSAFGWPGFESRARGNPRVLVDAALFAGRSRRAVAELTREGKFDRIVGHWAVPSVLPTVIPFVGGVAPGPIEAVSHGADVRLLLRLPGPLRRRVVGRLLDAVAVWRFVSQRLFLSLAESLDRSLRCRMDRVARIVPSPVDVRPSTRLRAELSEQFDGRTLFVSVGRLVPSKRVDRALRFVAAQRERDGQAELAVIGDGPERPRLERMGQALNLPVRFLGVLDRDKTLAWIASASGLIHASESEGLSTVVREAHVLGTPVIDLST